MNLCLTTTLLLCVFLCHLTITWSMPGKPVDKGQGQGQESNNNGGNGPDNSEKGKAKKKDEWERWKEMNVGRLEKRKEEKEKDELSKDAPADKGMVGNSDTSEDFEKMMNKGRKPEVEMKEKPENQNAVVRRSVPSNQNAEPRGGDFRRPESSEFMRPPGDAGKTAGSPLSDGLESHSNVESASTGAESFANDAATNARSFDNNAATSDRGSSNDAATRARGSSNDAATRARRFANDAATDARSFANDAAASARGSSDDASTNARGSSNDAATAARGSSNDASTNARGSSNDAATNARGSSNDAADLPYYVQRPADDTDDSENMSKYTDSLSDDVGESSKSAEFFSGEAVGSSDVAEPQPLGEDDDENDTSGSDENEKRKPEPPEPKREGDDKARPLFKRSALVNRGQPQPLEEEDKKDDNADTSGSDENEGRKPERPEPRREANDDKGRPLFKRSTVVTRGRATTLLRVETGTPVRSKRSSHNTTDTNWPHDIPVVYDSSYEGSKALIDKVWYYISRRLCVKFHDVSNKWDPTNPTWFTQNGFETDSYLLVKGESGCNAKYGQGSSAGPADIRPCTTFGTILHEFLHALGTTHSQSGRIRDAYLTINKGDIMPDLMHSYDRIDDPDLVNYFFDPESEMMYTDKTWSANGLETYTPIRDDFFQLDTQRANEDVVFLELSLIYRCNELYCNNDPTDCGLGYHTLTEGTCKCVCPTDRDPNTNCKEQINGPLTNAKWPNTPMVIFGTNDCPNGFDQQRGWVPITGDWPTIMEPVATPFPVSGKTITLSFCTKSSPATPTVNDWLTWPELSGGFCIIKTKGVACAGDFKEGTLKVKSIGGSATNGSIGDISVSGEWITMTFCCREPDGVGVEMDLPNDKPFRLVGKGSCPIVNGMRESRGRLDFFAKDTTSTGTGPETFIWSTIFLMYQCFYTPPVYGCNEQITLDANTRSKRLTTPGFSTAREPNRRCFYSIKVPKDARIRVTFNKYDLHPNDYFHVKRYHQWQNPYHISNTNVPYQIVSEQDYMSIEYWASFEVISGKGVDFTVDILMADEFCYDIKTKGEDYLGDKSVSETYEECVPWVDASTCEDFNFDGTNGFELLASGNKCRNPNGHLDQPWCYVNVNGTRCNKRYCDVCNLKDPVDMLTNCAARIAANPNFCTSAMERTGCFKSCGFGPDTYKPTTCGPPTIPSDGVLVGEAKSSYKLGEKVSVACQAYQNQYNEMTCTNGGWTSLQYACSDCPNGWVPYSGRCFNLFLDKVNVKAAEAECRKYGPSGTLFRVQDLHDQQMVREYKELMGWDYKQDSWLSGRLTNGVYKFTDSDIGMTYFNWTSDSVTPNPSLNCIRMKAEYKDVAGGWSTSSCDDTGKLYNYMCQLDFLVRTCMDKVATCETTVLNRFPRFCSDARSVEAATQYCKMSCGLCPDVQPCSTPSSSTYSRTSPDAQIYPGQVMTFACNSNLYHVGGDLERACSSSGLLLGKEPVCQSTPKAKDIKMNLIRRRKNTLPKNLAILLDHDQYRIPFAGKVSKWYYYCDNPGIVYLIIYRKSSNGYTYVGSNTVTCEADWRMTFDVPSADQIAVKEGDVFGAYSPVEGTVMTNECKQKLLVAKTMTSASFDDLKAKAEQPFGGTKCLVPSLALRVTP